MKNILIIGATSTIAQECAKSWSNRGYKILLIGRNQKKLKKIVENLRNNHKNIVFKNL